MIFPRAFRNSIEISVPALHVRAGSASSVNANCWTCVTVYCSHGNSIASHNSSDVTLHTRVSINGPCGVESFVGCWGLNVFLPMTRFTGPQCAEARVHAARHLPMTAVAYRSTVEKQNAYHNLSG